MLQSMKRDERGRGGGSGGLYGSNGGIDVHGGQALAIGQEKRWGRGGMALSIVIMRGGGFGKSVCVCRGQSRFIAEHHAFWICR